MRLRVTMSDAPSARITVSAIGANILPATPSSARIGTYTIMMIATAKITGRATSAAASRIRSWAGRSGCSPRARSTFSIITTAPSTISPKSIAPRLIRLPDRPSSRIPANAISIESGIAAATIIPARRLPSSRSSTTITSTAPSRRLRSTVRMVRSTSVLRS